MVTAKRINGGETMPIANLLNSKTFWSGVGIIIVGLGEMYYTGKITYEGLALCFAGTTVIGFRDAVAK